MSDFTNFVHTHLPLAEKLAKTRQRRYYGLLTADEVLSAAYWGLLKSSRKYQSLPETQFKNIAARCILNEIWDAARQELRGRRGRRGMEDAMHVAAKNEKDMTVEGRTAVEREVYFLVCCEGLSQVETSRRLGLTRRQVQKNLVRLYEITQENGIASKRSA